MHKPEQEWVLVNGTWTFTDHDCNPEHYASPHRSWGLRYHCTCGRTFKVNRHCRYKPENRVQRFLYDRWWGTLHPEWIHKRIDRWFYRRWYG